MGHGTHAQEILLWDVPILQTPKTNPKRRKSKTSVFKPGVCTYILVLTILPVLNIIKKISQ